ncbi:MAG: Dabb family protein [Lachnospiraceae bacterium]
MVKHVILWQLKDELTESEKNIVKTGIKEGLESLAGKIPGLVSIEVNINGLGSSNADVMLDSLFEDEKSLKGYAVHPEHVKVADNKVRPYTKTRVCLDYETV